MESAKLVEYNIQAEKKPFTLDVIPFSFEIF